MVTADWDDEAAQGLYEQAPSPLPETRTSNGETRTPVALAINAFAQQSKSLHLLRVEVQSPKLVSKPRVQNVVRGKHLNILMLHREYTSTHFMPNVLLQSISYQLHADSCQTQPASCQLQMKFHVNSQSCFC